MKTINDFLNKIIQGDAFTVLKEIPDESVDCIITSPPYWSCRSYAANEYEKQYEIGLEDHPAEYIQKIVNISLECLRVLKKTGVFYLNLGDVFYTKTNPGRGNRFNKEFSKILEHRINVRGKYKDKWLHRKGRLLLPFRIAIALQEKGAIIRDVIIWAKKVTLYPERTSIGTTIPFPCRDRLLSAYEYIFQIVKSQRYYFNLEPIKLFTKETSLQRYRYRIYECYSDDNPLKTSLAGLEKFRKDKLKNWGPKLKKIDELANPTNVIMFKKDAESDLEHYAKFPVSLVQFFILSSCPENGIVLDPFMGSGTVAVVAKQLNRNFIGIELVEKYVKLANERLAKTPKGLF